MVVVAGYALSFGFLALVLRRGMGLGVAYGIWAACGVVLTAILSALLFGEAFTVLKASGIVLIAGRCGGGRDRLPARAAEPSMLATGSDGGSDGSDGPLPPTLPTPRDALGAAAPARRREDVMSWLLLSGAVVERSGLRTLALRVAAGGRRSWYAWSSSDTSIAFALLSGSLDAGMPLGVAYGVWAAAGIVLTALLSRRAVPRGAHAGDDRRDGD